MNVVNVTGYINLVLTPNNSVILKNSSHQNVSMSDPVIDWRSNYIIGLIKLKCIVFMLLLTFHLIININSKS